MRPKSRLSSEESSPEAAVIDRLIDRPFEGNSSCTACACTETWRVACLPEATPIAIPRDLIFEARILETDTFVYQ